MHDAKKRAAYTKNKVLAEGDAMVTIRKVERMDNNRRGPNPGFKIRLEGIYKDDEVREAAVICCRVVCYKNPIDSRISS